MSDTTNDNDIPSSSNKRKIGIVGAVLAILAGFAVGRSACPGPTLTPLDAVTPLPSSDAVAPSPIDAPQPQCNFVGPRAGLRSALRAPRIVGGTAVPEGTYPYAVAIATPSRFQYCGGTLIAPRRVLTAAHCQVQIGDLVLVGSVDLTKARAVKIVESRINPSFDQATQDYDVAIAVLAEDVDLSAITLAGASIPATATVIGWGATSEGGSTTTLLQQVDVPIWSADDCRRVYADLTSRQICAGKVSGGADSCQGDSGGALLVNSSGLHQCARPGIPGVYTDLRAPEISGWVAACER